MYISNVISINGWTRTNYVANTPKSNSASKKPKTVSKKSSTSSSSASPAAPKLTKISATDTKVQKKKPTQPPSVKKDGFFSYFTGAWYELRQVRWPNRRATIGLTIALLGFTAFFVVIILLLDAGYQYLFKLLLS